MGSFGPLHWIIVAVAVLVLFGRGRISEMMGDLGKGVSSFKKGLADEEGRSQAARDADYERFVEAKRLGRAPVATDPRADAVVTQAEEARRADGAGSDTAEDMRRAAERDPR